MITLDYKGPRRHSAGSALSAMREDLYMNLLVVFLLMIGGEVVLTSADAARAEPGGGAGDALRIYLKDDGHVFYGSLDTEPVDPSDVEALVAADVGPHPGDTSVFIYHSATAPAGRLHGLLRSLGRVPDARGILALCNYEEEGS